MSSINIPEDRCRRKASIVVHPVGNNHPEGIEAQKKKPVLELRGSKASKEELSRKMVRHQGHDQFQPREFSAATGAEM
jgi:hypothetical protein